LKARAAGEIAAGRTCNSRSMIGERKRLRRVVAAVMMPRTMPEIARAHGLGGAPFMLLIFIAVSTPSP
jgi:hypothetical protein